MDVTGDDLRMAAMAGVFLLFGVLALVVQPTDDEAETRIKLLRPGGSFSRAAAWLMTGLGALGVLVAFFG